MPFVANLFSYFGVIIILILSFIRLITDRIALYLLFLVPMNSQPSMREAFFRKKTTAFDELQESPHGALDKNLTLRDLVSFGIAATIGAGIFSTIGNASAAGGPAIVFLYIFTAVACGFSALCYAEFASIVPLAGSAYTYSYAAFGELVAWIIGWNLIVEYAIGNITVAISWSDYFTALMSGIGMNIPVYFSMDYLSASRAFHDVQGLILQGKTLADALPAVREGYEAWTLAPQIAGFRLIVDLPALAIVALITYISYVGIRESKLSGNMMVLIKLMTVFLVIIVGAIYVQPANWSPFAPNGLRGVLQGTASVFFAYIGFDALSTVAEECKDSKRDMPRAIIITLVSCTILYITVALILTGLVPYYQLGVGDPLAFAFDKINMHWMSGIIAVSAVFAIASILLVYQLGQPRIWMNMSRDGLLPERFGRIHPKHRTPGFSTILTGFVVAIPALFMNLTEVTDLSSIGTLLAFVLVCGGILRLQFTHPDLPRKFRVPYINARYIFPIMVISGIISFAWFAPQEFQRFVRVHDWQSFIQEVPTLFFLTATIVTMYFSIRYALSLIPVLGLITCLYLMSELHVQNWIRLAVWIFIGVAIYLFYGMRHSKLAQQVGSTN